jgi:hypothetical protein
MWMYPGPSCPNRLFSKELGDAEVNTRIHGVLAHGVDVIPDFACKIGTHRMCAHDHLFHTYEHKLFTNSQMSRIKYICYIKMSLKAKTTLLRSKTIEDIIMPHE